MTEPAIAAIRLDKWLWHARLYKSRSLAAQAVLTGRMRLNGKPVAKPAQSLRPGDVLTFTQGQNVRVLRVIAPGTRRGPASEAQALYDDLSPEITADDPAPSRVGARPSGRDRRRIDALRSQALD